MRGSGFDVSHVSPLGHRWGEPAGNWYEEACVACEINVDITDESARMLLITTGGLGFDKNRTFGMILHAEIPELGLRANDRLEPSKHLVDIAQIEKVGFTGRVVFWRRRLDANRRPIDHTNRRNPIFGLPHCSPTDVVQIDTLHCLHLGVIIFFIEHVLWATLDANVWQIPGGRPNILELGTSRIETDIKLWYQSTGVPRDRRLQRLTCKMLGSDGNRELKLKAAEAGTLLPYAVNLCRRFLNHLDNGQALLLAGEALQHYMTVLKDSPRVLPTPVYHNLVELAVRHVTLASAAKIHMRPKHHLFIHLSLRAKKHGNPRYYSCFLCGEQNIVPHPWVNKRTSAILS